MKNNTIPLLEKLTDLTVKLAERLFRKPPVFLEDREKTTELVSYVFFGALTTLVSLISYFLLAAAIGLERYTPAGIHGKFEIKLIFQGGLPMAFILRGLICQFFSWVCAVLFAFFTNKRFVFRSEKTGRGAAAELARFALARLLSFLLIEALVYALLILFLGPTVTKIIVTVLVVVFNYFASKFAVFIKRPEKTESPAEEPEETFAEH